MGSSFLLLSPLAKGCGNFSTIQRIRSHLESFGHSCVLWDPDDVTDSTPLLSIVRTHSIQIVLVLHAYKAGRHTLGTNVPYVLIFGGTDINVFAKDAEKFSVMTKVVLAARCVISFSQSLLDVALELWPSLNVDKCFEIKQAVVTQPSDFSLVGYLQQHGHMTMPLDVKPNIFLFVGGIRPVKDPLYLVQVFKELHSRRRDVFYILLGSMADENYKDAFMQAINDVPGVIHVPGLSLEDTHAAIQSSFALVNSSNSEGMAVAVLEAMNLGVPVLVRDIPGNRSIVTDGENGLVYSSPEEFVQKAEMMLDDQTLRQNLVTRATDYVIKHHHVEEERTRYQEAVTLALNNV